MRFSPRPFHWSDNVAAFRYLTALRTAIVTGLATLTGQADYSPTEVAAAIKARLTSGGFSAGTNVVVTTVNNEAQLAFTTSDGFAGAAVALAQNLGVPNLDFQLVGSNSGVAAASSWWPTPSPTTTPAAAPGRAFR